MGFGEVDKIYGWRIFICSFLESAAVEIVFFFSSFYFIFIAFRSSFDSQVHKHMHIDFTGRQNCNGCLRICSQCFQATEKSESCTELHDKCQVHFVLRKQTTKWYSMGNFYLLGEIGARISVNNVGSV